MDIEHYRTLLQNEDRRLLGATEIPLCFRVYYGALAREGWRSDEAGSTEWTDVDLERGARVQGPAVKAYVDRLRKQSPDATPADIVKKLEARYLAAVMASGAAVGSAAAFPGIGTIAAMASVAG